MRILLAALAAASVLGASSAAVAVTPAASEPVAPGTGDAGTTPLSNDAVFKAFHGKAGIDRVVADLIVRSQADPRITEIFKGADLKRLQVQLADQFCFILDGPCTYGGKDMKTAHKDMGLQDTDLNALVEDLQAAMDKEGVPFRAQNQLLAKLAPMKRDVVTR